ncbi:MAG: hypothetical protein VXU46_06135 [Planctomycetota bacterium]|nr:hypothetical protein [Planctomycetota bacterium]
MRLKTGSALGTYSKGNEFSVSINFGLSGGRHCSIDCWHNPNNPDPNAGGDCYAFRAELRPDRKQLRAKLERHESMPASRVIGKATLELQDLIRRGKRIDWARISTNGSVPLAGSDDFNHLFISQLRAFLSVCKQNDIEVHFPLETEEETEAYRKVVGDLVVVRESIQNPADFVHAEGEISTSIGRGLPLIERVKLSRDLAKQRREATGRKAIVCPAVTSSFKLKLTRDPEAKAKAREVANNSKCGNCTACANRGMDIIYPAH